MNRPKKNSGLPPGHKLVPAKTVYLEMLRNKVPEPPLPPPGCAIRPWRHPPIKGYRRLFSAVGGPWGWCGRLILSDMELTEKISLPGMEIFRLNCAGKTAGFVELDRSDPVQIEIVYLGLVPEFIGRGLGKYLLDWTIHHAWEGKTERVWLHTCEFDHPQALATYLKAGFSRCGERVETQAYPEEFLRKRQARGG